MAKVGPDKSTYSDFGENSATNYGQFNAHQNAWGEPTVTPSAPPPDYDPPVTQQPRVPQPQFIPMPEPGPVYRPTHAQPQPQAPQPQFQPSQPSSRDYQTPSTPAFDRPDQFSFQPMPEPGPVYRPQPTDQSPASLPTDAPPSYQESQMDQDPLNRFRTHIFQSVNRLNALKSQILERESRMNEIQRKSELIDGIQFPGYELINDLFREMDQLKPYFRAAQQHLRQIGEKENFIPGTMKKKMKIHNDHGSCCGTEEHYNSDLCDKKPKIHIEGMCNSPDLFAQTCEQQHRHTGWMWGKQKVHIEGMWVSPKIHLKGLLFNPVIICDGMWCKPEIHLEGICLNPEIRVNGMGTHPIIRITGLCHNLKIFVEGMSCSPRVTIVGVCDSVDTILPGSCSVAHIKVTGACKNLMKSRDRFSFDPSVKFKGKDMEIRAA